MIKKLLETNPESNQLLSLLKCYEVSPKSLEIVPALLENKDCARVVLKQLNHRLYTNADERFRGQLFSLMIDTAVTCKIPEVGLWASHCH